MADHQTPLLGVILCCTSIPPEQRRELAAIAEGMGAVHKFDLTSDVTHLIVGETDTPKYKFVAKERSDVKCLRASFIEAVRTSWLEGGEANVEVLEKEHKLPTFSGLIICVTGFEDLVYRKWLEDSIVENGGEYQGNLTKDCTHLIAKVPSGAKYTHAGNWGIKIVAVEWLEQSLERGMTLDETLYNLAIPASERGKNAWVRRTASTTSLGKRSREEEIGPQNTRKLRRTASARLSSQNFGLWTDIVGIESKAEEVKVDQWDDQGKGTEYREHNHGAGSEERPKEMLPEKKENPDRSATLRFMADDLPQREGIFQGKTFLLHGFNERQTLILQGHLQSHGADMITDIANAPLFRKGAPDNFYYLVPHTMARYDVPTLPATVQTPTIVTEFWVERCLFKKKFDNPCTDIINSPFSHLSIAGFKDMSICSTSFQGIDLVHVSKAIKLMGGTYEEFLTSNASVLVCNSVVPGHEKLLHAHHWGVPAVKANWLWDTICKGKVMPFGPYIIQLIRDSTRSSIDAETAKAHDKSTQARNTERLSGNIERTAGKQARNQSPPKETYKQTRKESSYRNEIPKPTNESSAKVLAEPSTEKSPKNNHQALLHLDDDEAPRPIPQKSENNSSEFCNTASPSVPLKEITPNSSPPKPSISPTKAISSPKPPQRSSFDSSTLGPAISSLLAHHQRTHSDPALPPAPISSTSPTRPLRRRRPLLGRAPSNLSSHSHSITRASSVDTMNTDGLGTPLEPTITSNTNRNSKSKQSEPRQAELFQHLHLLSGDNGMDDPDREQPQLQMTQLGYEDPDVAAWRERVTAKMAGEKPKSKGMTVTPGRKSGGKADLEVGGLGIAKRTRGAVGR